VADKPGQRAFLDAAILLNRVALGLYFVIAGWGKVSAGVASFVAGPYAKQTPPWLPSAVAVPYGYALPFIELLGGLLLIAGLFGRVVPLVLSLLLLSIAVALKFAINVQGPFHHSVVFATLAVLLAAIGPGRWSVDAALGWDEPALSDSTRTVR
jgi:putative oxidoreductase